MVNVGTQIHVFCGYSFFLILKHGFHGFHIVLIDDFDVGFRPIFYSLQVFFLYIFMVHVCVCQWQFGNLRGNVRRIHCENNRILGLNNSLNSEKNDILLVIFLKFWRKDEKNGKMLGIRFTREKLMAHFNVQIYRICGMKRTGAILAGPNS